MSRPCAPSSPRKVQLITGRDTTGSTQLEPMEFQAHQSLVQMERGSTVQKSGDSMNGWTSLRNIRVDSSWLIISIFVPSLLLLAERQGFFRYSSVYLGRSFVVLGNVGLEIIRDLRNGMIAGKGTIFAGISLWKFGISNEFLQPLHLHKKDYTKFERFYLSLSYCHPALGVLLAAKS